MTKASKIIKGAKAVSSLRDGIPEGISEGDICIVMTPSVGQDYVAARSIASSNPVVIINGLAKVRSLMQSLNRWQYHNHHCSYTFPSMTLLKDQKSVPGEATMAYFLKPLTYNSQVVGYLARSYPKDWTTIDLATKECLATYSDSDILFGKTNTPDLRNPGKRVQKAVDDRAIQARQR